MQSPVSTSANMRCRILVSYMYVISGVLLFLCRRVLSHGRLIEPPGRSTMWRYGFNTPVNYNDNELYCGGKSHQWDVNGGKCGVCGDPYDGPRDNEAGGKYATGTISRCFNDTRSPLVVRAEITANHKGYFEFRLCPHDDPSTPVTQECLNDHLLMMYGSEDTRYHIGTENKVYEVKLKMPESITCTQCVLQWKYNTGNSWGCNSTHCENGLGPQEQFYGCADISVGIDCGVYSTTTSPTPSSSKFQSEHSTTDLPKSTVSSSLPSEQTSNLTFSSTTLNPQETNSTMSTNDKTSSSPSKTTYSIANKDCRGAGAFTGQQTMTQWCRANCIIGFCPSTHCKCVEITTGSHSSVSSTTSASSSPLSTLSSLSSRLIGTAKSANTEKSTSSTSTSTVSAASGSTHPSTTSQSMRRSSTTPQSMSSSVISQSSRPSTTSQSKLQSTISQSMHLSTTSQSTQPSTTSQSMRLSTTTSAISDTTKTISAQSTANEQLETMTGKNSAGNEEITTLPTKTESSTVSEHLTTVTLLSTASEQSVMSGQPSTNSEELSTQSEHSTRTSTHSTTSRQTTSGQRQSQTLSCEPTPVYSSVAGMAAWCLENCQQGYCPSSHCVCTLS